jgi:4-amino-4-deoxy-L-arabinose transferase-like glycosyltransferase
VETTPLQSSGGITDLKRDLLLLVVLLFAACALRTFLLFRTEVPARDTIGFIRYALQFETKDWASVMRANHQHPGYPLTIYAVSLPVRAWSTLNEVETMSFSARLASNLAAVLLVIPLYFLGKLLLNRPAGFGGALLFQCLPVPAHILSDGLSEPLYLAMVASGLVFATMAFASRKACWFLLCGAFCGLAYLTRPEGGILLASGLLVLLGLQCTARHRRAWREVAFSAFCLVAAAAIAGSPYILATRSLSNKPSVHFFLGSNAPNLESDNRGSAPLDLAGASFSPALATLLAFNLNTADPESVRGWKAIWGMASELVKSFHYVVWAPALLGMWWFRRRLAESPGTWVLLVNTGILTVVLWRVAVKLSYISDRHLLVLVMFGCIVASAALWELPVYVGCWLRRHALPPATDDPLRSSVRVIAAAMTLLAMVVVGSLPKSFAVLHANRAGHHAAGVWLASHVVRGDVVQDQHCWAHYFAGCVLEELRDPVKSTAADPAPTKYIVIGRREREHIPSPNIQEKPVDESDLVARGGHIVFHWPENAKTSDASVVVYELRPPPVQPRGN